MAGVLRAVLPVEPSEGVGCLLLGLERVSGTYEFSPLCDGVLRHKFHSNREVRGHEVDECGVEGLAIVLGVKLPGPLLAKLEHLQIGDGKFLLSSSNHLPKIEIGIGFEHSIGSR